VLACRKKGRGFELETLLDLETGANRKDKNMIAAIYARK